MRLVRNLFAAALAVTLLAGAANAQQQLKIGTVDMQALFKEYHVTNQAQKEINVARAQIQKEDEERLVRIRELETELQGLRKQFNDPSVSDQKKREIDKQAQVKQQEGMALDRERREFMQRKTQALNESMMLRMRGILEDIRKLVEERAKADDYDHVFDKSGLSQAQVPVLLYSKDRNDLTADILKVLNKDAPPATAEDAAPAPAPAPGNKSE
jgi:outer membrane protein